MKEAGKTVSLWASRTHADRIEWAKGIGINVSAVANAIWDKHLAVELEKARAAKAKELKRVLEAPMP